MNDQPHNLDVSLFAAQGHRFEVWNRQRNEGKGIEFLQPAHFIPLPPFLCLTIFTPNLTARQTHGEDYFAYFVPFAVVPSSSLRLSRRLLATSVQ